MVCWLGEKNREKLMVVVIQTFVLSSHVSFVCWLHKRSGGEREIEVGLTAEHNTTV